MNNPGLYRRSNGLQVHGTLLCLDEYKNKIKWNNNKDDRVIDIGCADGNGTVMLKNIMPDNNTITLLGCDVSNEMVQYANEHHGFDETSYRVLNIEDELPGDLINGFDHVFSFYTFHWIKEQEKAFRNIYNLLDDNGDCLVSFIAHSRIFDVYRVLARSNKWSTWVKDVNRYVSPYHDLTEPERDVSELMNTIGFKHIEVKCKQMIYQFEDMETLKNAVAAVNPFNIPDDLVDDFVMDVLNVARDMRMDHEGSDTDNNKRFPSNHCYHLIVAYARK